MSVLTLVIGTIFLLWLLVGVLVTREERRRTNSESPKERSSDE